MSMYPEYVVPGNAMKFISDDGGSDFNLCICTSFSLATTQVS